MKHVGPFIAAAALGFAGLSLPAIARAEAVFDAPVAARQAHETGLKTAVFAGGCFWGTEAVFSHVRGVTSVISGFSGGTQGTANYRRVSAGGTGHAEAVKVTYDPDVVRYDQLLQILFSVVADPTLQDRQGPDVGSQYRAAIMPRSDEQRAVARAYVRQMGRSGVWNSPIRVQVERAQGFFPAEDYHQDFAYRNPGHPYIRRWDAPKVRALREQFPQLYRSAFRTG
ncbi:peptide-methionine (S)-S-oxide reductase MsrA [Aurantiacibacter spongiae]|uniref:Peptide methionine sulfoxide reductase MsrA n=1 Tax=Aurantiacibacter spongiae TaxID=2488860 RepID=A0A3N5DIK2_9SPHN|nr:peptide-methionine (S)-S-oxide reductase MsrA [Aurantiacibacter spongiae]RPF71482.1 peptide-methionine (S)-S-oxide reductase [Aurantiacibacter spongiae]